PWQITVIDNASTDDGADIVARRFPEVRLIRSDKNLGFAGGCNRGVQAARGADFVVLLNPDAILAMDALEKLAAAFATRSDIGVLGCKLLEPDVETIQHVGVRIAGNGLTSNLGQGETDRGQYRGIRDAVSISGAVLAVRSDVWCELGGFDEKFWPAYFEETDFCLRARAAHWGVAVACDAVATHFHASFERWHDPRFLELYFASRGRFLCKHYRGKDWLARYLPAELKWLFYFGSKGMRRMALRTLWKAHKALNGTRS
ncbi:glycosyltransferase family 2 protein, partial [bacterium]|nr:glycosyltransferase family 2 protein [bacterium]